MSENEMPIEDMAASLLGDVLHFNAKAAVHLNDLDCDLENAKEHLELLLGQDRITPDAAGRLKVLLKAMAEQYADFEVLRDAIEEMMATVERTARL